MASVFRKTVVKRINRRLMLKTKSTIQPENLDHSTIYVRKTEKSMVNDSFIHDQNFNQLLDSQNKETKSSADQHRLDNTTVNSEISNTSIKIDDVYLLSQHDLSTSEFSINHFLPDKLNSSTLYKRIVRQHWHTIGVGQGKRDEEEKERKYRRRLDAFIMTRCRCLAAGIVGVIVLATLTTFTAPLYMYQQ